MSRTFQVEGLNGKISEAAVGADKLRRELAERDGVIAENYRTLQGLRRRVQELETHKFVLSYKVRRVLLLCDTNHCCVRHNRIVNRSGQVSSTQCAFQLCLFCGISPESSACRWQQTIANMAGSRSRCTSVLPMLSRRLSLLQLSCNLRTSKSQPYSRQWMLR